MWNSAKHKLCNFTTGLKNLIRCVLCRNKSVISVECQGKDRASLQVIAKFGLGHLHCLAWSWGSLPPHTLELCHYCQAFMCFSVWPVCVCVTIWEQIPPFPQHATSRLVYVVFGKGDKLGRALNNNLLSLPWSLVNDRYMEDATECVFLCVGLCVFICWEQY